MTGQAMLFTLGRSDGVSQGWFSMWLSMMGADGWFAGWLKAKEQYTGKTRRDLGLDESRINRQHGARREKAQRRCWQRGGGSRSAAAQDRGQAVRTGACGQAVSATGRSGITQRVVMRHELLQRQHC